AASAVAAVARAAAHPSTTRGRRHRPVAPARRAAPTTSRPSDGARRRSTDRPDRPIPPHGGLRRRSSMMAKNIVRKPRKKVCMFCQERLTYVDYKDTALLRKFISDRGKIRARRVSGNCRQHQRDVATAVKNAREVALLPYTMQAR